jgi:hypothetical protein
MRATNRKEGATENSPTPSSGIHNNEKFARELMLAQDPIIDRAWDLRLVDYVDVSPLVTLLKMLAI